MTAAIIELHRTFRAAIDQREPIYLTIPAVSPSVIAELALLRSRTGRDVRLLASIPVGVSTVLTVRSAESWRPIHLQ